jgi:hypothetical protein
MCFNQLERSENVNKAMMESWVLNERTYETDKTFYSYGTAMDMVGSMTMDPSFYHRDNPTKVSQQAYQEYNWLFGNRRK